MWKIIKKSVEKIVVNKNKFSLWMKWEFNIEFASDSFGPYHFKFERTDCYFNDWLEDRGTKIFPLKNKQFDNTEIFLETDDIVIAVGERWSLLWGDKNFIDVINIKTEKKYRLFTDEVNLIFNTVDAIVINAKEDGVFKTIVLNTQSMQKVDEKIEELEAFFKCVYNKTTDEWYLLDFAIWNNTEADEEKKYQSGSFSLKILHIWGVPKSFERTNFKVNTDKWYVDVWEESKI